MFYETIHKKDGREIRKYAEAENLQQLVTYFYDKEQEAELLSIQKKEVIRGIPEGFYVNIPAGYKSAEDIAALRAAQKAKKSFAETVIEITWLYKKLWDLNFIQDIPYQEFMDLIKDVAEKFEKIHKDSDWLELDFCAEIEKFAKKEIAVYLWGKFGDIPMNPDTEEIEIAWNGFEPGTHREDIWHWFEETFDVSVAEDLMHV